MRKQNSIKNIKNNIVFFIINSIFIFLSKTVLIKFLGTEYTGLNAVFTNVLNFMNVAELGITSAVTYSLYKPLKDENYELVKSIVLMFKEIYKIIGNIVAVLTFGFLIFINNIVKSDIIGKKEIIIFFIIYASKVILSYHITYMQIVAVADQKSYIITKISGVINIIKTLIQIVLVIIFKSYFIWLLLEVGFTALSYIVINKKIKLTYNWIIYNQKIINKKELFKGHLDIFKNTKNLVIHKIGKIIVYQTDNILLSMFTSLTVVTIYSNYAMITNLLSSFLSQIFNGIRASIGNLIAENNDEKVYRFWKELNYITLILAIIICFCFYINVNNLIYIWLGEDFIVSKAIVMAITINMFFLIIRNVMDMFKEGYGIFGDIKAPIIESIINFVCSIILVKLLGLIGVIIGTVISNIFIVVIWQPYVIYNYGFKMKIKFYLIQLIEFGCITIFSTIFSNMILSIINITISNNIISFVINCTISLIIIICSTSFVSLIIGRYRIIYFKYLNILLNIINKNINLIIEGDKNDNCY